MASDYSAKIFSLIFTIGRQMRDEGQKRNRKKPPFSLLHFHTLRYVGAEGRPLTQEVAKYLRVTPPAATLLVDGLVKEGLISRKLDHRDHRVVRLALTKKGKAFLIRTIKDRKGKFKALFSVLTSEEQALLINILGKVAEGRR